MKKLKKKQPSNKSLGNEFELKVANMLHDKGFWVHRLQQNEAGQPGDIIAVRNDRTYLIECKHCSSPTFRFSRIEPNQWTAMKDFANRADFNPELWINFPEGVAMMPYDVIREMHDDGIKGIKYKDATTWGYKLEEIAW